MDDFFKGRLKRVLLIFVLTTSFFAFMHFSHVMQTEIQGSQLPGNTGKISGNVRIAEEGKDKGGALTYGPYVELAPGEYKVKLKYSATSGESGLWDMIFQGANSVLKSGKLPASGKGVLSETIKISGEDAGKPLEIRAWYTGKGSLEVGKIEIKKHWDHPVLLSLAEGVGSGAFIILLLYLISFAGIDRKMALHISKIGEISLSNMKSERIIKYVTTLVMAGFIASVIFHYIRAMFYNDGVPFNTFLPPAPDRFCDFYGLLDAWTRLKFNGVAYGLSYLPSTYLIVDLFSKIGNPYIARIPYLFIFGVFFMVYAYSNLRAESTALTVQGVVIFSFMTYPVLFTLHTGNIEAYVFIFLCLFIYFYQRGKTVLSALFLAMPISMKLFPAVFLILLLADKKYKEILYVFLFILILTLLPLLIFDGGLRSGFSHYLGNLIASQKMYAQLMIIKGAGNHYGHSLLNALRILFGPSFPPVQTVMLPYFVFTMVFFAAVSAFIIFYETAFWKKVALLVMCMDLLPYTSTDYKLMHLFIPLFLFINKQEEERWDFIYIIVFSLLLIPKDYFYFYTDPYNTLNSVMNSALMLLMLLWIIGSGISQGRRLKRMAYDRLEGGHGL
ncbi:MAG: glycosyltransferase 87 family protein [Nitrospiraceae bacterium]|nr:glycosyltransferase 87 family protein [Nitrospiraceae bacterium]